MTPTLTAPVSVAPIASSAPPASPCPLVINGSLRIPPISDFDSFQQWLLSAEFPEKLRVSYLAGVLWLDLTMESFHTHNQVKEAVGRVLGGLVLAEDLGYYVPDGMRLTHPGVGLSAEPDGMFASYLSFDTSRVREILNAQQTAPLILQGTPDMVLEVISDSSVDKDLVVLPPLYQAAGVPEFWRIDARGNLNFEILRLTPTGYAPTRLPDDWWCSDAFGHDFRLTAGQNRQGRLRVTLEVR